MPSASSPVWIGSFGFIQLIIAISDIVYVASAMPDFVPRLSSDKIVASYVCHAFGWLFALITIALLLGGGAQKNAFKGMTLIACFIGFCFNFSGSLLHSLGLRNSQLTDDSMAWLVMRWIAAVFWFFLWCWWTVSAWSQRTRDGSANAVVPDKEEAAMLKSVADTVPQASFDKVENELARVRDELSASKTTVADKSSTISQLQNELAGAKAEVKAAQESAAASAGGDMQNALAAKDALLAEKTKAVSAAETQMRDAQLAREQAERASAAAAAEAAKAKEDAAAAVAQAQAQAQAQARSAAPAVGGGLAQADVDAAVKRALDERDQVRDEIVKKAVAESATLRPQMGIVFVDGPAHGVLVSEVRPGKACERAGFLANDIITYCAGVVVTNNDELKDRASKFHSGDTIPFTIERDGQVMTLNVLVGDPKHTDDEVATIRRQAKGYVLPSDMQ